ncbi:MAG: methyltransferase domain-containing protein [Pseudomonadota bacterium]
MRVDAYLGGQVHIAQPAQGYRAGTDPVLVAAAVPAQAGDRVLELGCGVGTALACLAARVPGLHCTGVERVASLASYAARNLPDAQIVTADLTDLPGVVRAATYQHVLMNPPYQPSHAPAAPNPTRDQANREDTPLAQWFDCAARRCAPGGSITVILPTWRLGEVLAGFAGRCGDITVLPLSPRPGQPAQRVISQARKGRAGPLRLLAPLVLHQGESHAEDAGAFSSAAEEVLRRGAALRMSRSLDT